MKSQPAPLAAFPHSVSSRSDYRAFLKTLKARILDARTSAIRAVNGELVLLYWDIGRGIVEKQQTAGWGDAIVERLAADLRAEFPDMRGFSANNLWMVRQFYSEYSAGEFLEQLVQELPKVRKPLTKGKKGPAILEQAVPETAPRGPVLVYRPYRPIKRILAQPVPELPSDPSLGPIPNNPAITLRDLLASVPWGHHVELLKKIKTPAARLYYLRATARFGWSRNVLLNQIHARAFEHARKEKKTHNFPLALPGHFAEQAADMMKSRYNFEFLGIGRPLKERRLEDHLIARLQQFILELGYGFCFVGRQYRLALGAKEYFVDLLFYHRFLKALVAFDLKVGAFEPEHAGKMDFYLNLLNAKERAPDDQPSIGIILCAQKDDVEVEFSLNTKLNPIGVAQYQLQSTLPARFKGRLPTAPQLAAAMRDALP
jgi:predicted nuclease of restriction endonuclease-like (RecB) superfamily